jgi:Ca-activated chloride channel family protein
LNDDGSAAARRFHERVRNPLLTDIRIDWRGLPVSEVYPERIPDLFSAKPVVLSGRFNTAARGTIRLEGKRAGKPFSRDIRVDLPAAEARFAVLPQLWARTKIDHLMHSQTTPPRDEITKLGLDYRLMTPFTSFVAVDEKVVNEGGKVRRVEVPVEMPDGVSYDGVFGGERMQIMAAAAPAMMRQESFLGQSPERHKASTMPAVFRDEASKVHPALAGATGKVEVQVWVTDTSADAVAKLKVAGLEILNVPGNPRRIVGRIDAAKLQALTKLAFVTYISPRT